MAIRLALPGNRYLSITQRLLHRLDAPGLSHLAGPCSFSVLSCSVTAFIAKPRDTLALVQQSAVHAAIVPDEWLLEHLASAPDSVMTLGRVPWLDVRLSVFGPRGTQWPPVSPHSVITPFPDLLRKRFHELCLPLGRIYCVSGTTEAFVPAVADLGFDIVETGATLRAYGLEEQCILHPDLQLSLISRGDAHDEEWTECAHKLLREAHEARIADPA
jgi:ATP phosphoribosyltransferase